MGALRPATRERLLTLALFLLVLTAFALRLLNLGRQDLWGDEAFSAWLARRPLSSILRDLAGSEPHPPLYPLLLWAWLKVAGNGEFALRYPSVLSGVVLVPLLGVLGRRIRQPRLAFVIALLITVNPFLIWYSQEARMYALVAACAGAAAVALLQGLSGGRWAWLLFAIAATAMIYAHYFGLLVLAGFTLVIAFAVFGGKLPLRPWLGALGLVAVLYLPWVFYAARIFFSYYGVAPGRIDLGGIFRGFWLHSALGPAAEPADERRWLPLFLALMLLGAAAALGAVLRNAGHRGAGRRKSAFLGWATALAISAGGWPAAILLPWLLAPLVGGLLISIVRPMYAERYLIVSTVPFLVLVAFGIAALRRWWPLQATALLLVLVATFAPLRAQYFDHRYVKSEYSQHIRELDALAQPNDFVILDAPSQVFLFDYYYDGPLGYVTLPHDVPLNEAATAAELRQLANSHSGIWLFLYATHDYDPGDFVEQWLSANAFRAWHTWTINGRLVYYGSYPDDRLVPQTGTARFGDQLALRRFAWRSEPYEAGEVVPLLLDWRADGTMDKDFKVSLRLRDAEGFLWGQTDAEPLSGFRPTRTWAPGEELRDRMGVLILPGTPPGRYRLEMRVYPAGGQPVPVASDGLAADATALTLGEVVVARPGRATTGIGIPAFRPIGAQFGGQIALEGESGTGEITAGQSGYLTVLWRALQDVAGSYEAVLRLVDRQGQTAAAVAVSPVNGTYGTAQWRSGDVLRWQHNLRVPATTPPGEYRLVLALRPPASQPLIASALADRHPQMVGDGVELQRIVVKPRPQPVVAGKPQVELRAQLGDQIRLRGYALAADALKPGGKLALTLYWEALTETDVAYTVFAHLLDGSERIVAQQDLPPCAGGCPTTGWLPGDLIEDRYELPIKPEAPPGEYQIEVGMYEPASGRRLPVLDKDGRPAGDRILLPKVRLSWPD